MKLQVKNRMSTAVVAQATPIFKHEDLSSNPSTAKKKKKKTNQNDTGKSLNTWILYTLTNSPWIKQETFK
jgi:hypothetical protein